MPVIPVPELPDGGRFALLVGTSTYADAGFGNLSGPAWDVEHLADVLSDPRLGGFAVRTLMDPTVQEMRTVIELFLRVRRHEDLTVVYLSGHGVLDPYNELYFAATDTGQDALAATALEGEWLRARLARCLARRQVLILDCCHAGAFPEVKGGGGLRLDRMADNARGRLVLHAARASESAFGTGAEHGVPGGSAYTTVLVEGLRTGAADLDQDGYVGASELHAYIERRMRELGTDQTPQLTVGRGEGTIFLTRSPVGRYLEPAASPEQIRQDLEHPRPGRRIRAISELAEWLDDPDPAIQASDRSQDSVTFLADGQQGSTFRRAHHRESRIKAARAILAEAERIAADIADDFQRAGALAGIVPAVALVDPDRAQDLAAGIGHEFWRAEALAGIAPVMAASDPDRAESLALGITYQSWRVRALAGIAPVIAATDSDRAEGIASGIGNEFWRAEALTWIAPVVAVSDPDRAGRIAAGIRHLSWKEKALAGIAPVVARSDLDRAELIVTSITQELWRAKALAGIASVVVASDPGRADRLIGRAERIVLGTRDVTRRTEVQAAIAPVVAAVDPDRALSIAADIADASRRAEVLADVAPVVAASNPDRAERIAAGITHNSRRAKALAGIARVVAVSDPGRAQRLAADVTHPSWRAKALAGIARAMVEPER